MYKLIVICFALMFFVVSCQEEQENIQPNGDFGYLSIAVNISLDIQKESGRIQAVNTDDFKVEIYAEDGTLVQEFARLVDMPAELELVTGNYYVKAHSNNLTEAAFEEPYYEGTSAVFPIKKGDVTTIQVDCELANVKVTVLYTQNIIDDFVDYQTIVTGKNGVSLTYGMAEIRAGYFDVNPLTVDATLTYEQSDGTPLTKVLSGIINAPQPKDHYIITVDAILEDGVITPILINVDETTNDIGFPLEYNIGWQPGDNWSDERDGQSYATVQIGNQVWMAENLNFETPAGSANHGHDPVLGDIFGRLYIWDTAMNGEATSSANPSGVQGVCPVSWHMPSEDEWRELMTDQGGIGEISGRKLKSIGSQYWVGAFADGTNESGFTALPAGSWTESIDSFGALYEGTYFWSSTETSTNPDAARGYVMRYGVPTGLYNIYDFMKFGGFSVRCVKD